MSESNIYISRPIVSFQDYPSTYGSALTYFFKGCSNDCPGCHNANTFKNPDVTEEEKDQYMCFKMPNYSEKRTEGLDEAIPLVEMLNIAKEFARIVLDDVNKLNRGYKYIVLQGGDPLYERNRLFTKLFINEVASHKENYRFKICLYTGCVIDDIQDFFTSISMPMGSSEPIDIKIPVNNVGEVLPFVKVGKYDRKNLNDSKYVGKHTYYDGTKQIKRIGFASKNQILYKYNPSEFDWIPISDDGIAEIDSGE